MLARKTLTTFCVVGPFCSWSGVCGAAAPGVESACVLLRGGAGCCSAWLWRVRVWGFARGWRTLVINCNFAVCNKNCKNHKKPGPDLLRFI